LPVLLFVEDGADGEATGGETVCCFGLVGCEVLPVWYPVGRLAHQDLHYQADLPDVCCGAVMGVADHGVEDVGEELRVLGFVPFARCELGGLLLSMAVKRRRRGICW
jgi:hypothetical protein